MKDDFICQRRQKIFKHGEEKEVEKKKDKKVFLELCVKKTLEYVKAVRTQQRGALLLAK